MQWKPSYAGEYPTLGHYVLRWMISNLAQPGRLEYEPFIPTKEQAEFLLRLYRVDTGTGMRRLIRRALLSRPRGWGKSPFLAAIAFVEALADVVPDGFDAQGRPVGRPWATVTTPLVQFAAVSEAQTKNAWRPALEMSMMGPLVDNYPGVDPMNTVIILPKGQIEPVTASAKTLKGAPCVACVMDQTEMWTASNGGHELRDVLRANSAKLNGLTIESPNAFISGQDSVAEQSAHAYKDMSEGRARVGGVLYSHREAPAATDMSDRQSLLTGLAYAYGDSADIDQCSIHTPACTRRGWMNLPRLADEIWDPSSDPQVMRSDYLNQITHASNAWLTAGDWEACADASKVVSDKDMITLGFDGSRRRKRGMADATALMGCRVRDGHVFEIAVWEQPRGAAGEGWEVSIPAVRLEVEAAFRRWTVVGFYADPARWEGVVADWEAQFGKRLQVNATREHPIEWWTAGRQTVMTRALDQFENSVVERELTHDGSSTLTRHALNARRIARPTGYLIAKEHPDSTRKIDAVMAAVLAYAACVDAVGKGVMETNSRSGYIPRRIM